MVRQHNGFCRAKLARQWRYAVLGVAFFQGVFGFYLWIIAMSNILYHRIYEVVRHISYGRVATYGQVATVVGPPVTAQQVGEAMAALRQATPELAVPWQRVINAQGKVSTGRHQQTLLEQEGVVFNAKGSTDLRRFGWQGPDPAWAEAHGFFLLPDVDAEAPQLDLF
jgi:methylated-DNA-protein-cysteine methyltransferase-like protein